MVDENDNPVEDTKETVLDKTTEEKEQTETKTEKTVEKETENKPSDREAELLKEVMKLKEAKKKSDADAKSLKDTLSTIDLDKAKAALAKVEEIENAELERKGEYQRLLDKQKELAAVETKTLKDELENLKAELASKDTLVNRLTVGSNFSNSSYIKDNLTLTPNKTEVIYGSYFDLVDGNLVGYDKPKGYSNRTMLIDSAGDALGFDKAIEAIVNADPEKDSLIKSKMKTGASSKSTDVKVDTAPKYVDPLDKLQAGIDDFMKNMK